jgi:hypothetical protein
MKKIILKIAAITYTVSAILTSCNTPDEKVKNAEVKVTEANKNLNNAQEEYAADVEKFRKNTDSKIAANEKSMAEFEERIATEKKAAKADYKKKIAELEQKNTDMKKRMDDYKADGKEKWESFKREFNENMDELGQALKDLTK